MKLSQESHDFFDKVSELTQNAPILASRILSIANSASSATSSPITNIQDALIRLGIFKTLSLITTISVSGVISPSKPAHNAIWRHSLETAYLCRYLAGSLPEFSVDKELAYLCGLLHDIGRFVMLQISSKIIDVVDSRGWNTPVELPAVEDKLFGFTHADVGYIAAKKWQLPETITNVIQQHHQYDLWKKNEQSVEFRQLLTIVQLADSISVLTQVNPDWHDWSETALKDRIVEDCIHKDWPTMDFKVDDLILNLPNLYVECEKVLKDIGVGSK